MMTMYFYLPQGWIFDNTYFREIEYQDTYIQHLKYSTKIQKILIAERASPNVEESNKYFEGQFFTTINAINSSLEQRCLCSSLSTGRPTSMSQSSFPSYPLSHPDSNHQSGGSNSQRPCFL